LGGLEPGNLEVGRFGVWRLGGLEVRDLGTWRLWKVEPSQNRDSLPKLWYITIKFQQNNFILSGIGLTKP